MKTLQTTKKTTKRGLAILLCLSLALTVIPMNPITAFAATTTTTGTSVAPNAKKDVVITNNVKKNDTIYVSGLAPGDTVTVYTAATGGKKITSKKAGSGKTDVTISLSQLGAAAGSLYLTVTTPGMAESARTKVSYEAEPASAFSDDIDVTITNNAGIADTILVEGLEPKDVISVYSKAGKLLKSGTVSSGKSSVTISITQLGTAKSSVFLTLTSAGKLTSGQKEFEFAAERSSEGLSKGDIEVINNVTGTKDQVIVSDLTAGDIITVYNAETGGKSIGKATCSSKNTSVTINISQIGKDDGSIYVSRQSKGFGESGRLEIEFEGEQTTDNVVDGVTIENNPVGTSDIITVDGLEEGDTIKVYKDATKTTTWGKATVASGNDYVVIKVSQLGVSNGTVWITNTRKGMNESSTREAYTFEAEKVGIALTTSTDFSSDSVEIVNNAGTSDTITVHDVNEGDTICVYSAATRGTLLASGKVAAGQSSITMTCTLIGKEAGYVYISVQPKDARESARTQFKYAAEVETKFTSDLITEGGISVSIINNAVIADEIIIKGLNSGELVKVYSVEKGGTPIVSDTVAEGKSAISMSTTKLLSGGGNLYISITAPKQLESGRLTFAYEKEEQSSEPDAGGITITNNAEINDEIEISGLVSGDFIKVYDKDTCLKAIASGTASGSKLMISVPQLGSDGGTLYFTRTSTGKAESPVATVGYLAEEKSDPVTSSAIRISNNASPTASTFYATDLVSNTKVYVYDKESGGSLLGSGTVGSTADDITFTLSSLPTGEGSVYVTVTAPTKLPSDRVKIGYAAKKITGKLNKGDVEIQNNASIIDVITVRGLNKNDTVKVYESDDKTAELIESATASSGEVTINAQLESAGGSVWVSVTSTGKLESERVEITYLAEKTTEAPATSQVSVLNKSVEYQDEITVTGLLPGDTVYVYSTSTGGVALKSAIVAQSSSHTTVSVPQLGKEEGAIYVSVKNTGKFESARTSVRYNAESIAPLESSVAIVNNAGTIDDVITVTGLEADDFIKVYSLGVTGTLLGSASSSNGTAIITPKLSSSSGDVYITRTSKGRCESSPVKVSYLAEQRTVEPFAGDITITNNVNTDTTNICDSIDVINLKANDFVRVYDSAENGNILGSLTVGANQNSAHITVKQLGTSGGYVYVTVTSYGKTESIRVKVGFAAE